MEYHFDENEVLIEASTTKRFYALIKHYEDKRNKFTGKAKEQLEALYDTSKELLILYNDKKAKQYQDQKKSRDLEWHCMRLYRENEELKQQIERLKRGL